MLPHNRLIKLIRVNFLLVSSLALLFNPYVMDQAVRAETLVAKAPDILLQVSRNVTEASGRTTFELTRVQLESLPQQEFTTSTIWTRGKHVFSGPALHDVLNDVEAEEGSIFLSAANGYRVEFPWDMVEETTPIIATRIDGEP